MITFCVNGEFLENTRFKNLSVVSFEELKKNYPATKREFIATLALASFDIIR